MKYKDDLPNGYVNGYYVGQRQGGPTQDKLEPQADGYEVQRNTQRQGTVTQDALQPNYPVPDTGTKPSEGGGK
ncbi:hypothetical protein [Paenibacillus azoreducens]|uniref:Uncharacterized protein n=1 Tax=Paenibacillus azoreducens TaxID=116718 RepID=A0A919YJC0_9BACL|nr:hypothetical protein [Paenibacillus azoreducens]GIO51554.1 hypothetical protein J34TS1_63190 [Paenibacillus azoreducens]